MQGGRKVETMLQVKVEVDGKAMMWGVETGW